MNELPNCPQCNSEYVYEYGSQLVCPECAHSSDLQLYKMAGTELEKLSAFSENEEQLVQPR